MAEEDDYKLTFDHQCFLMDNYEILSPLNEQCGYENFHAMGLGNGASVHDVCSSDLTKTFMPWAWVMAQVCMT